MSDVKRLFVEKKEGFDIEARRILDDLRNNLGINAIQALRLINRYDVEGLSGDEFERASRTVLSEPNVDKISGEMDFGEDWRLFATEYLPGQYDQRADSAAQCIALLTGGEQPSVLSARIIAIKGDVSDSDFDKIKSYLINPVESRQASMEKPASLEMRAAVPPDIVRINGFIGFDDNEIGQYHAEEGFAMSVEDLCFCRDYFKNAENRNPSLTELKVIDTYWSDHCRHTTFLTELAEISVEKSDISKAVEDALYEYFEIRKDIYGDRKKNITLMDIATIGTKALKKQGFADNIDESEEINACSIEVPVDVDGKTEQWLVQFKNETHNHPTEIEPFGGAATCLGGAIRDPLSGRAYVYQAMRVTGCGNPLTRFEDTLNGKLPQKKITTGAAQGYSSYGNQIGLSTGQVTELYDEGYTAKRLEIGAVIGASPKENVIRKTPAPGDVIVLLGGRTGRDGCGGATGSSKAHDSSSIESCGAQVQKGNPPTERKLQRLFRNPEASRLIKRCNDFGAGGVCVAIGELADGLEIKLDAVPKKYEGLDGTELAISESQERMAVVLDKTDAEKFIALAREENLEATPVAAVSESSRLVMYWRGDKIVDLSREFLNTNGVTQRANVKISAADTDKCYINEVPPELSGKSGVEALRANLARLEVCSQKGLVERFDSSIGAATVLMPYAGKYQLTPEEAMCAKLPVEGGKTDTASVMSFGFIPGIGRRSPFHGAVYALVQSLAKLAAVGADPKKARLTMQEYFERLGSAPERWGKPTAALLGALTAQLRFKTPAIGGKDSMSGSFNDLDVPPTLVCFAVAMARASEISSAALKKDGSMVALVKLPVDKKTCLPVWDKANELFSRIYDMVKSGKILSASVVCEGGAAACVCRMAFGDKYGFRFADGVSKEDLYSPLVGSFVCELAPDADLSGLDTVTLGTVTNDGIFYIDGQSIDTDALVSAWLGTLESVFPTKAKAAPDMTKDVPLYKERSGGSPAVRLARPRVIIPVFPGTNCELDTARAFEKAGADVKITVVKNLTPEDIEQTVKRLCEEISKSQILMLPGGFSGGDEPDGSGKFIATALRNERIKSAVTDLLDNRDGLILGICNGFQALIKVGLVPYGRICDTAENDPTLTFNLIGRHVSCMAYTRVTSVKSPWLAGCEPGEIHAVPVSHGEGRFAADGKALDSLIANGQIASQYIDPDGNPSGDIRFNPNGSACAVEGITSPDGRVLGKMGHSERYGENLYKNVPGNKNQRLFESGVRYFK